MPTDDAREIIKGQLVDTDRRFAGEMADGILSALTSAGWRIVKLEEELT